MVLKETRRIDGLASRERGEPDPHSHTLRELEVVERLQRLPARDRAAEAAGQGSILMPLHVEKDDERLLLVYPLFEGNADIFPNNPRTEGPAALPLLARDHCAATSAMATVMHAIAALHEVGVAHHDVHPGNVLFRRRRRRRRAASATSTPLEGRAVAEPDRAAQADLSEEDELVLSDLGRACMGEVSRARSWSHLRWAVVQSDFLVVLLTYCVVRSSNLGTSTTYICYQRWYIFVSSVRRAAAFITTTTLRHRSSFATPC